MEFLTLTWNDVFRMSLKLAEMILGSPRGFDLVVAVLRGGYVVAKLLSDALSIPQIDVIEIKYYKDVGARMAEPVVTKKPYADLKGKSVLLVDDVADTGATLAKAVSLLKELGVSDVVTAVLFYKPWSRFKPDYYVEVTDKWIVFPWGYAETILSLSRSAEGAKGIEEAVDRIGLRAVLGEDEVESLVRIVTVVKAGRR